MVVRQMYKPVLGRMIGRKDIDGQSVAASINHFFAVISQKVSIITRIGFGWVIGFYTATVFFESYHPRHIPGSGFRITMNHYIIQHLTGQCSGPENSVIITFGSGFGRRQCCAKQLSGLATCLLYTSIQNFDTSFRYCPGSRVERNISPYLRKANQKTDDG